MAFVRSFSAVMPEERNKFRSTTLAVLLATALCIIGRVACASGMEEFHSILRGKVARAEGEKLSAIAGRDGWLFFVPELRSLSIGPFWGELAVKASRSSKPEYADPLPAIVDFNDQLKKAGIDLLLVPVPAKAAVYPDRLDTALQPPTGDQQRFDPHQKRFYDLLTERGVTVVDLLLSFIEHRDTGQPGMYCQTDSHWSGAAVALAAQTIAEQLRDRPWFSDLAKMKYDTESREIEISGDLARMIDEKQPARERLSLEFVGVRQGGVLLPVETSRDSPVLLMGDSHTLVFHDPELFAKGAGLPDHLALRLGGPVDLVGVRGSGASTTRIELLRRRDNLKGKKLVIWCFSFREFTESFTGWRQVPVIR
ncbi:MAG TPA: hypothetical protein VJ783_00380 [Pirellulales bacterium]|nr:hypothetical protein [Pirellulales bacterium]